MTPDMARGPSRGDVVFWIPRAHWALGIVILAAMTDASRGAIALASAAFVAGTWADLHPGALARLSRIPAPLSLASALAAGADLLWGSGDLLVAVAILVLGVQAALLLGAKRPREGWTLSAISFLEFLAAAAATEDLRFAAFAVAQLGLGAGAMWALATLEGDPEAHPGGYRVAPKETARFLLRITALGVLFTALLFLVTPRLGIGQILRRSARGTGITGFSETISFREVTGIKLDRRVVARIEFPGRSSAPASPDLYLRGGAYARFDGTRWSLLRTPWRTVPRSGPFYFFPPARPAGTLHVADVALEPRDADALFLYGAPLVVEGSLGEILTDGQGAYEVPMAVGQGIRYRLQFTLDTRPGRENRPPADPAYLEIPPGLEDLRPLAARIAGDDPDEAAKARRILAYFRANFRYSLSDPAPDLRSFLERRAGHCEHFATALCLLLRACGVPARVAAGYLGGEWNDIGKYLIVRQSDAHAWTEAWTGGRWITLDATPSPGESSPFAVRTGMAGMYADWLRQRWNKYVVNYSLRMQATGVRGGMSAARRLAAAFRKPSFPRSSPLRPVGAGLAAAAVLAGLLLALRSGRGPLRARREGTSPGDVPLPRPYERLIRRLSREGCRERAGDTTEDLLRRAVGRFPALAGDADRFLRLYRRDRFGPSPLPPEEIREAARLADRLRKGLSSGGAA